MTKQDIETDVVEELLFDNDVAVKVMGWTVDPSGGWRDSNGLFRTTKRNYENSFSPSVSANSDYEVLCHVRETWYDIDQGEAYNKFWDCLWEVLNSHRGERHIEHGYEPPTRNEYGRDSLNMMKWYRVGDYARAARMVIERMNKD